MQKKIKKNIKQRYLFKKFEKNRLILKILSKNLYIEKDLRWKLQQKWFFGFFTSLAYVSPMFKYLYHPILL